MTRATINGIAPCFIVSDVTQTLGFYCGKLGFEVLHQDPETDPFFAMISRDGAVLFVKSDANVLPAPNPSRNPEMKWDAYVFVPDPDALAAEFAANGLTFHKPLGITTENLRGFDVRDPDGYVLFFGRPN